MIRITVIFAILALVFVQLVNGQLDACQTALLNGLETNSTQTNNTCLDTLTGNDTSAICEDPCRSVYDAIIDNCNETVSQASYLTYSVSYRLSSYRLYTFVSRASTIGQEHIFRQK